MEGNFTIVLLLELVQFRIPVVIVTFMDPILVSVSELYYGGEALPAEQAQSFTCPYCGKMGFTEVTLQEHVTSEHADASTEVVSICGAFFNSLNEMSIFKIGRLLALVKKKNI